MAEPPQIAGVRRSFVEARGVRFHVTEAGPPDGRPVVALHGWPQHHWVWRDLLANPPVTRGQERSDSGESKGLRIIAPDLPGYGWSGPAPHKWGKNEVAEDVVALMDALGLDRVLLVGHDWGAFIGYLIVLQHPERVDGYLPMNMAHPWTTRRALLPHAWRLLAYQPLMAFGGVALAQRTRAIEKLVFGVGSGNHALDPEVARIYADRFRDPVPARAGRDTYRTFLLRELKPGGGDPSQGRTRVPIRALFGVHDFAVNVALADPRTAKAHDYTLERADTGHFIVDERPDLVRERLISLAEETAAKASD